MNSFPVSHQGLRPSVASLLEMSQAWHGRGFSTAPPDNLDQWHWRIMPCLGFQPREESVSAKRGPFALKLSFKLLCSSLFLILSALLLRPRARQITHSSDFLSPSRIARKTLTQAGVQFYKARYQKPFQCALLRGRKKGKRNSFNFIIKESKH